MGSSALLHFTDWTIMKHNGGEYSRDRGLFLPFVLCVRGQWGGLYLSPAQHNPCRLAPTCPNKCREKVELGLFLHVQKKNSLTFVCDFEVECFLISPFEFFLTLCPPCTQALAFIRAELRLLSVLAQNTLEPARFKRLM